MGDIKYRSTLNRHYNKLINNNIITDIHRHIVLEYMNKNEIDDVYIYSIDTKNGNCNKNNTAKSFKLHKQALRTTIICNKNKIPLIYRIDPARECEKTLGLKLASEFHINDNKKHFLVGDKGYVMNNNDKQFLEKNNKLRLITQKKNIKKVYQTKNYKRKIKKIRHSKQMKKSLKNRKIVEYSNNILHRLFIRLQIVFDKSIKTFNGFIDLAIICMILHHNNKTKKNPSTDNKHENSI